MSENRSTAQPTAAEVFPAADIKHRMAEREPAKAAEDLRHMKEQQKKQEAVMEGLHKPFDRSADQLMQVVTQLVSHHLGPSTEADHPLKREYLHVTRGASSRRCERQVQRCCSDCV